MFYQYILYIVYNMYLTMVKYNDLSLDFTFFKKLTTKRIRAMGIFNFDVHFLFTYKA